MRYFIHFRNSDTGLLPTFKTFKKASDLSDVVPPAIIEVANGMYYFDYTPTFEIVFLVDGTDSIPTEEVRYVAGSISHRDAFIDEPVSQVKDDVWNDGTDRAAGTKGQYVESIGVPADGSAVPSVFGRITQNRESIRGDTAGTSDGRSIKQVSDTLGTPAGATVSADVAAIQADTNDIQAKIGVPSPTLADDIEDVRVLAANIPAVKAKTDNLPADPASGSAVATAITTARDAIRGAQNRSISEIAGAGFSAATDTLEGLRDAVDTASSSTATILAGIVDQLRRTLGLLHENSLLDNTQFDANNNLTSGRLRIYDSKVSAIAAEASSPGGGTTGLLATYTINAEYVGANLVRYLVSKE